MSNPLIAKWEELYGPKKEEPKKVEYEFAKEYEGRFVSVSNASVSITPKPPSLVSNDIDSGKDSFLQVAEKIKNGEARVTYTRMDRDIMSGTTITFEVEV